MRKVLLLLIVSLFTLFLVACNKDGEESQKESPKEESQELAISEEEKVPDDEVVAIVNGKEINGITYNLVYAQLKLYAMQFGQDITDEEIKESTIESVIDRQILLDEAAEIGIEYSDEYIEEEMAKIKENGEENLQTLLEQFQINESAFAEQLKFELTMEDFLKEEINVTVTDEEVEAEYEKAKAENENMPELVEIRDTFKRRIENVRKSEALQERIEAAKEDAEIEILL